MSMYEPNLDASVINAIADRFIGMDIYTIYSRVEVEDEKPGECTWLKDVTDFSDITTDRIAYGDWSAVATRLTHVKAMNAIDEIETTDKIKSYLRNQHKEKRRGIADPEKTDLSSWAKTASRKMATNTPYQPEPGCKAKLKLKDAVMVSSSQEAYADYTTYAVPFVVEEGADMEVCERNLGRFCRALKTHNGFAGSGCTYDAHLEDGFAVITQRASISD